MRTDNLIKKLEQENVDAMLVTSGVNMHYMSGFRGGEGYMLVSRDRLLLLVDSRYTVEAKRTAPDFEVVEYAEKPLDYVKKAGIKKLAVEEGTITAANYSKIKADLPDIEFCDGTSYIANLRAVKDKTEIAQMQTASDIAEAAYAHILSHIKVGMKERDIALELEFYMRKNGAECVSFPIIAVAGENSAMPHGSPSDREIRVGDLLTLDLGAVYKGYCSDMTRTIAIGSLDERGRHIYASVLAAQLAAIEKVKAGVPNKEPDIAAREVLKKEELEQYFKHGLGHGVGLQIHESPGLSQRCPDTDILQCGNVITIEPGVYIEGYGGVRIEDMVMVTDCGIHNFNKSSKELFIVN